MHSSEREVLLCWFISVCCLCRLLLALRVPESGSYVRQLGYTGWGVQVEFGSYSTSVLIDTKIHTSMPETEPCILKVYILICKIFPAAIVNTLINTITYNSYIARQYYFFQLHQSIPNPNLGHFPTLCVNYGSWQKSLQLFWPSMVTILSHLKPDWCYNFFFLF